MSVSYQLSRRKGTTNQHSTFVGINGELTVDTDKKTVVVHDGVKAGGYPLAKEETLSQFVKLTGDQPIDGVKTFTSNIVGNITGNAATATKLRTARTINGVAFDGSANITVVDASKAPLDSPEFTGTPTAPTPSTSDNSTRIATTAFAQPRLESGTNIKTINGTSILGSGDIVISASLTPTTAQVGTATAGLGAGAVGSYSLLYDTQAVTVNPGATKAGSLLMYASVAALGFYVGSAAPGTWRCMSYSYGYNDPFTKEYGITLWLRIA